MANADTNRLTVWVRAHGPALSGYLGSQIRDPATVDDLLQEVFVRAWEARGRYEETGKERAYLFRIADRLVTDYRRRRPWVTLEEQRWADRAPLTETPTSELEAGEDRQRLNEALGELTESQRRVLLLRYFSDMGFAEIASLLEIPLGTALSHARRGLASLRKLFEGSHS